MQQEGGTWESAVRIAFLISDRSKAVERLARIPTEMAEDPLAESAAQLRFIPSYLLQV